MSDTSPGPAPMPPLRLPDSDYGSVLADQLRLNGMPEAKVREVVAEVEDHVATTGQDPVEAFGQPVDYAAQWQPFSWRHGLTQMAVGIGVAAAGGSVFAAVFTGVLEPGPWTNPVLLNSTTLLLFGLLALNLGVIPWTLMALAVRREGRWLGTGRPKYDWTLRLGGGVLAGVGFGLFVWWAGSWDVGSVHGPPRWLTLVAGLLLAPLALRLGPKPGDRRRPSPPGIPPQPWWRQAWRALRGRG
ncbi:hypothetical protein BCF74_10824 [Knoellia remsis]|uniref:Uncharacterized protein n=1 Tax=Knoellia remsis TaxID=407159 RepID=A0A2T0UQ79_9MICO|nr:hypothetical protein [Knoellia remsis]PRY60080.1 hypothetical protein BCF74_10824 [Knoellia remsis]